MNTRNTPDKEIILEEPTDWIQKEKKYEVSVQKR